MIAVSIFHEDVEKQIKELERQDLKQLLLKIAKLNKITWLDAVKSSKHGGGSEKIDLAKAKKMPQSIKNRLPNGQETFIVFRYDGLKAVLGYRCSKDVYHILHLDNDFTAYEH